MFDQRKTSLTVSSDKLPVFGSGWNPIPSSKFLNFRFRKLFSRKLAKLQKFWLETLHPEDCYSEFIKHRLRLWISFSSEVLMQNQAADVTDSVKTSHTSLASSMFKELDKTEERQARE